MGIFDGIFRSVESGGKVSRPTPNVANAIGEHIRAKWPEIVDVPGLWFSGSTVWSFLYGDKPPETSDLDVFTLKNAEPVVSYGGMGGWLGMNRTERTPIGEMLHRLGLKPEDGKEKNPSAKPHYHVNGADFTHARGEIDVWTITGETVQDELRRYPAGSHSHCRAAFSFRDGLVVLPNENAK